MIVVRAFVAASLFALAACSASAPMTRAQGEQILAELAAIRADLAKRDAPAPGKPAAEATAPKKTRLDSSGGHAALGRDDAPVTIVEFTDLQCPFCARFARGTFPQLRKELIDTGKVRFVTRDMPLAMHPKAVPAAVAARCAGEQGHYWEFREALFVQQAALGDELYASVAESLGLDAAALAKCRAERAESFGTEIQADKRAGNLIGITGTPTFVVGRTTDGAFTGERIIGAKPFAAFETAVNAVLAAPAQ